MPKVDDMRIITRIGPERLRLILERLHSEFYEEGPPSDRIAAAVLEALKDLEQGPSLTH